MTGLAGMGGRLKRARKAAHVDVADAAVILGVTQRTVRRIEAGETRPSLEQVAKLAVHYECSLDALVFGETRAAA